MKTTLKLIISLAAAMMSAACNKYADNDAALRLRAMHLLYESVRETGAYVQHLYELVNYDPRLVVLTSPMAPPRASISRTICPLAIPPMDGLQDIWAMVSKLWLKSRVLAPVLAAARAASQPACPPPITITSYSFGY